MNRPSVTVPALSDDPRRDIQNVHTVQEMWGRLHKRHDEKTVMKKLSGLKILLNMRVDTEEEMSNHVVVLCSQFLG